MRILLAMPYNFRVNGGEKIRSLFLVSTSIMPLIAHNITHNCTLYSTQSTAVYIVQYTLYIVSIQ